jgi:hypothetical protein
VQTVLDPIAIAADSLLHEARGRVALVTNPKAAAEELAKCQPQDFICQRAEITAREQAIDKDGADAVKKTLVDTPSRSMTYVYVRAELGTIPSKPE